MDPRATIHSNTYGSRVHATLLVTAVLLAHLYVLDDSVSGFAPDVADMSPPRALVTRRIDISNRSEKPQSAPMHSDAGHQDAVAMPQTTAPPDTAPTQAATTGSGHAWATVQELEDLQASLSAPVALPTRSAEAVDLPPFNRSMPEVSGQVQMTAFKAPRSALLRYDVKGQTRHIGYSAWADLNWQQNGEAYNARLEVGAFLLGSRVQTSVGTLGLDGLMPTRFGDKSRSELAAHFQREKNTITFSANSPDVPLLKGAQDRLSVVLQLGALLAADPSRFPPGTMLSFQTVSQREAEIWQFVVEKEELLRLPYGDIHAIKLQRNPRREFDQRIELWLAPSLDFLPARLRITNANGDFVDQSLRTWQVIAP